MARGKHAVKSANRRSEAKDSVIDRLTDELADAKARARMVEREAAAAERLRADNAELRRQLDDQTGPALQEAQLQLAEARNQQRLRLLAIAEAIHHDAIARAHFGVDPGSPVKAVIGRPHGSDLTHLIGPAFVELFADEVPRDERRLWLMRPSTWVDVSATRLARTPEGQNHIANGMVKDYVAWVREIESIPAGPLTTTEPDVSSGGSATVTAAEPPEPTPEPRRERTP